MGWSRDISLGVFGPRASGVAVVSVGHGAIGPRIYRVM